MINEKKIVYCEYIGCKKYPKKMLVNSLVG